MRGGDGPQPHPPRARSTMRFLSVENHECLEYVYLVCGGGSHRIWGKIIIDVFLSTTIIVIIA